MGVNDVVVLKYRLGGDRYDKLLYYASTFMFMTKNDIFNLFYESVKIINLFLFLFVRWGQMRGAFIIFLS